MFKHDQAPKLSSSRYASHRRPSPARDADRKSAMLERVEVLMPATHRRARHRHRNGPSPQEAAMVALQAAEVRISELEKALAQACQAAFTDPLTGALNRRGFADAYQREWARARRNGSPLALALIDIDDFKRLNDTFGHHVGDEALRHLVSSLRGALRPSDILCRFGGEEFIILLPETGLMEACAAITRILRHFTAHPLPGHDVVLSFSAGVVIQDRYEPLENVLYRADAATYQAKRAGKNCVITG